MVLLNSMIRNVAITGSTDSIHAWLAGRQGGRWAQQTVRAAFPLQASRPHRRPLQAVEPGPPEDAAETLRKMRALRDRGIVTDAEVATLRARLGV